MHGVLYLGNTRYDHTVQVGQQGAELICFRGGCRGQGCANLAGFDLRPYRQFGNALAVVGDPVDQGVTRLAKVFGCHVLLPLIVLRRILLSRNRAAAVV